VTECYRCGQEGHSRSKCPDALELPAAAPAESRAAKLPGYGTPVPWFPPQDPEVAHRGSAAIRHALRWIPAGDHSRLRAIAAAQVAEARKHRLDDAPYVEPPAADQADLLPEHEHATALPAGAPGPAGPLHPAGQLNGHARKVVP